MLLRHVRFANTRVLLFFFKKKTVYRDSRRYLEKEDKLKISLTFSSSEDGEKPSTLSVLEEKHRRSKFDKIKVGNKHKLFKRKWCERCL